VRFQRFSARRTVDLKARRVGVNQGVDLDLRLESLVITGGLVTSGEDLRSSRKELASIEWSRRKE